MITSDSRITEWAGLGGTSEDHLVQPPAKQDSLEHIVQDGSQVGFEYLQRRRHHSLSGQPIPVLCHPHSTEVPPHSEPECPVLQFVPTASEWCSSPLILPVALLWTRCSSSMSLSHWGAQRWAQDSRYGLTGGRITSLNMAAWAWAEVGESPGGIRQGHAELPESLGPGQRFHFSFCKLSKSFIVQCELLSSQQ